MDQGAVYPLKKFLKNFSGHVDAGRIERVDGGYRLTTRGMDYFSDRYRPGNRQYVEESEVRQMMRHLLEGGHGWEVVE